MEDQEELFAKAEEAAGGSLDYLQEIKSGWWRGERPDGTVVKIEWEPAGHGTTNEGPHVTVRELKDPSAGPTVRAAGGWSISGLSKVRILMVVGNWRSHPNWSIAIQLLQAVRPGSLGYDPEEIAGLNPSDWIQFPIEDRADPVIGRNLIAKISDRLSGIAVVVTFASYLRHAGPFFIDARELRSLIDNHAGLFDDLFFSTDVTIVIPRTGTVAVVHHNGLLAVLDGNSAISFEGNSTYSS